MVAPTATRAWTTREARAASGRCRPGRSLCGGDGAAARTCGQRQRRHLQPQAGLALMVGGVGRVVATGRCGHPAANSGLLTSAAAPRSPKSLRRDS